MSPKNNFLILATAAVALLCVAVCAFACFGPEAGTALSLVGAAAMSFLMKDANLKVTKALPNGAASVTSNGIDLMESTRGDFVADVEWLLSAPALAVGQLANGSTMTYIIEHDTDVAFGTAATLIDKAIVQTGAGGVGDAAKTYRFRLPTTVKRYIRAKATNSAAADASAASLTLEAQL